MAEIPDYVILRVLPELPVKSLLRFKCLCKTWYSTISDPHFCSKLHRKRPSVLICQNSRKFSTINIESLLTDKNKALTRLSLPWETEAHCCRDIDDQNCFIGSCNGLVCVDHKGRNSRDWILWNPSTRKFIRLPRPAGCNDVLENDYPYILYVWFGYDESVDDYKLVWLNYLPFRTHTKETELHVFTLKSNTWRRVPIDDSRVSRSNLFERHGIHNPRIIGVLFNGAIHWHTPDHLIVILALDLATETFELFDPPIGGSWPCVYDQDGSGMTLRMMNEYSLLSPWYLPEYPRFYPILFSKEEGKEVLAVFDNVCLDHKRYTYGDKNFKLRIEERGEKVRIEETLLCVPYESPMCAGNSNLLPRKNDIVLHMEESLVSLTAAADQSLLGHDF